MFVVVVVSVVVVVVVVVCAVERDKPIFICLVFLSLAPFGGLLRAPGVPKSESAEQMLSIHGLKPTFRRF